MKIDFEKILACPKCKNRIRIFSGDKFIVKKESVYCSYCGIDYMIEEELFNFVIERNIYSDGRWVLENFVEGYKNMGKLYNYYDWAKHDGIPKIVETYRFPLMRGRLLEWLKPKDGNIILDVGCGAGLFIFEIMKFYPDKDIGILGLDVVRNNIKILMDRKRKEQKNCIFGIVGYAEELPISQGCIDIILCSETLEHICDKGRAIREVVRVLKPNGRLLISTPSKEVVRFWEYIFCLPRMVKRILENRPAKEKPKTYDEPLSKKQLINLLLDSGMDITKFEQSVFLLPESYYSVLPYIITLIWIKIAKLIERYLKKTVSFFGINYVVEAKKSYNKKNQ